MLGHSGVDVCIFAFYLFMLEVLLFDCKCSTRVFGFGKNCILDAWQINDSIAHFATEELGRTRQKQLELEMVRYNGVDTVRQTAEILANAGIFSTSQNYKRYVLKSHFIYCKITSYRPHYTPYISHIIILL